MPFLLRLASCALVLSVAALARAEPALSVRPTLFFESSDVDRGAWSDALHLGLSGQRELAPGVTVQAELSLLVADAVPPGSTAATHDLALADNSSFLRLHWLPSTWSAGEGFSLTIQPLHADRLYLGYEFPLVEPLAFNVSGAPTQGAELRLDRASGYARLALKTNMLFNYVDGESHRAYTVIAGGGIDVASALRLEAEGTHADLGVNPEPGSGYGKTAEAWGLAARVMFHRGLPIGPPSDFARYRGDPAVWENLLRPDMYDGALSLAVSGELLFLSERGLTARGDNGTMVEPALGFAGEARVKWRRLRGSLRGQYRQLSLIEADVPGFPPFFAIEASLEPAPEIRTWAAVDYSFEALHLTPGVVASVWSPATLKMGSAGVDRVAVVNGPTVFEIQPAGDTAGAMSSLAATCRWDVERFTALAEVFLSHDPNRTTFKDDVLGPSEPIYTRSLAFGFDLLLQARF